MKILGLVASPRKLGNSEILVKEMLSSLPAEIDKEMIQLTSLAIQACQACYACLPTGEKCVLQDDLGFLLDKIREADAVILASPCYFLGSHTSIKTIGDRLISVLADGCDFAGKKCVTVVTYGIPGWEGYAREAVNNFVRFLHLDLVGDILVQAASPGEVVTPEIIAKVQALAAQLLAPAPVRQVLPERLACQGCGSSLLQTAATGEVRCVMCGMIGRIVATAHGFAIQFSEDSERRFSPSGMERHGLLLEDVKRQYIANRSELFQRRTAYKSYDYWVAPDKK